MEFSHKARICFFLRSEAEEAARFYTTVFPDGHIDNVVKPDPGGPALVVEFTVAGLPMMTLNGNPNVESSYTHSVSILTDDQEETDRLWAAFIADGGEEGQCGWLKDKFGMHWQIVPRQLPELMSGGDAAQGARIQQALMPMKKIDIASLIAAAAG